MAKIDDEIKTEFTDSKHRFFTNLVYTANSFQSMFVTALKPFGISPQQFNILKILRENGSWMSMNSVKELMIDKAPNATRLSDKLIDKGLITRRRCETDRRVVFLLITDEGLELLKRIDEMKNDEMEAFKSRITDAGAAAFSDILDRLRG